MADRLTRTFLILLSCVSAGCTSASDETAVEPVDVRAGVDGGSDAHADTGEIGASGVDTGDVHTNGTDTGGEAVLPPVDSDAALAYVAHRGVSTPWLIPVDGSGPGPPIQLGPRRGAGYGLGEGDVSYPDITPDGAHVVVAFYPMATPSSSGTGGAVLFALSLAGDSVDAPTLIARADRLHALERTYRDGWMAYVDGNSVYAARLDGSDAGAPILVATAPEDHEIDYPRWVGSEATLTYTQRTRATGQGRKVFMASVDASGATEPAQLHTGVGPAEHVVTALPGERVVLGGPDHRLHALPLSGSAPPVVLTPEGLIAGYVGSSADGGRIVVELRVTWKEERELVSVATDGSEADAPRRLTPVPTKKLSSLMSRDGAAVAWVGTSDSGAWAAFRADTSAPGPDEDPRITPWSTKRLHVTAFDAAAGALVGGREDGAVLRYTGRRGSPEHPQVLALVADVVNHSIPWPELSADGTHVIYDARQPTGWHSWVLPLAGGDPVELPGPWYRDLVTPLGVLTHEYVNEGALFVTDMQGAHAPLVPWHDTQIYEPHLVEEGRAVLYACETPVPGFYAAPTASDSDPAHVLVMPLDTESTPWRDGWRERPATAGGHLLRRSGSTLRSFALDGSHAGRGLTLAEGAQALLALDPAGGRAVFVVGSDVVSTPVDGTGDPTVVMPVGTGSVTHLGMLPGSDRVLVGVTTQGSTALFVAPVDGSGAASPGLVAADLPGWFMGVALSATAEHVFTVHSIEATAVPHPDLLLAAATGLHGGSPAGVAYSLAPHGYMLWQAGPWYEGGAGGPTLGRATTSADGVHAVLAGPGGLYAAKSDGSEAEAPRLLGTATRALGEAPLSPDGKRLLLQEEGAVTVAEIDRAGSQRRLTTATEGVLAGGAWTPDGRRVVFASAPATSSGPRGALFVVEADAQPSKGRPLHPDTFAVAGLAGITPGGESVVVESTHGADHSLYLVPLDAAHASGVPPPVTPVDDVGERFLGFVPAE